MAYNAEYHREWWKKNKEKIYEVKKQWIKNNPERWRASSLLNAYRQSDKINNRGECTLTIDWIIENIFSKHCSHCDESDWTKIGCNRIDNSKPHTPDNVEPCCFKCNMKLINNKRDNFGRFVKNEN